MVAKAAYMVVGIDLDGYQDVLVVAVDHFTGFREAIATVFPKADVHKCIVHQIRNSIPYAARKDYAALTAALRPIYLAAWQRWSAAAQTAAWRRPRLELPRSRHRAGRGRRALASLGGPRGGARGRSGVGSPRGRGAVHG